MGLATLALFAGCKNDLDVTADYQDITLVYGLLNQNDTAHYIKINKAYLGEGNAFFMAGVSDSVNYAAADLDVKLEEYNTNGTLTNTFPCVRTVNEIAKDTGLFANDANILYKTTATLNAQRTYKLVINNNKTGKLITATTPMINGLNITTPQTNAQVNLIGNNFPFTVKFQSAKNAMVYSMTIRFTYTDVNTVTSDVTANTIDWPFPNIKSSNANGGEDLLISLDPDGFCQFVASKLSAPGQNIERHTGRLEFVFYAGGEELTTYLDVNGPSNTLQQEKPEYTNINNGLGVFSCRFNTSRNNITLAPQTIDSLINGRFTNQLGFTQ